jgi:transaldolase
MMSDTYLDWLIRNTATRWWHDSAEADELTLGLERGCVGVTTNPVLSAAALKVNRELWAAEIDPILSRAVQGEQKAEALMRIPVSKAAQRLMPSGFVCAQVNPGRAGERECMLPMARRLAAWSPNIAVKLPATAAGLDVLEDCVAEGITCTATVSFTVPQVLAIAERHRAGIRRAKEKNIEPGKCFAVIMIGRLDDYLREVARDSETPVSEADIQQAGLAVAKRAYSIYIERKYEAVLLVAALRGTYHLTELAGAGLIMSIHPSWQGAFVTGDLPREERIHEAVPGDVIHRLESMPEFVRAYEPDGMAPAEFLAFGTTQRTLSQFIESGWKLMENYR